MIRGRMGCMAADLDIFVRHRDGMRRGMLQLHIVSVGIAREIESKARLEERIEDGAGCRITADPLVEVETIPGEILNRIIVQTRCPQILDAGSRGDHIVDAGTIQHLLRKVRDSLIHLHLIRIEIGSH